MYIKELFVNTITGDNVKQTEYEKIVNKHKPKEKRLKNAFISFVVGGIIGSLGQGLIELYMRLFSVPSSIAGTYMIVTFVFIASLFTALGFFDSLVEFAKCGLIIPITGFSHSMTSAALDAKSEGPIYGIGNNIFRLAGSVILYGIVSAWFFGMIRYFIGG